MCKKNRQSGKRGERGQGERGQSPLSQLGDKFDIRGFHDANLGVGPLPEPLLAKALNNWIEEVSVN